jgi:hypothetical protein
VSPIVTYAIRPTLRVRTCTQDALLALMAAED